jgi:hypothetical protein
VDANAIGASTKVPWSTAGYRRTVPTMEPVDFLAFAGDCTITAKTTMFGARLTDFLNGQDRFRLSKVTFEALEDGRLVGVDSVSIEREELLAVIGTGPRGSDKRRTSLETQRMELQIGPYLILGQLHHVRGSDALRSVTDRDPMVPFTNATVAYNLAGRVLARDVGTIIVNRSLVEWIAPTADEAAAFPDVEVRSPYMAGLVR